MELAIGTYLNNGKYRIEKVLGQGSFGITYLATAKFTTNGNLGKMDVEAKVAIKEFFMSDVNSRKADGSTVEGSKGSVFSSYRNKFRKEADNLRKLDCPGIVKVYDVFDENGTTYYSMEYLNGGNLDEYISKNNPIDESEAISIIRDICNALALMHDKRMLHLDLKPKNIMRTSDGKICLIDFGLSKQFTADGEPESTTSIGQGTPGYAPLEQAKFIKDGSFPATLDVYALGATMYKILTGVRPLEASDIINEEFPKEPLVRNRRSESLIEIVEKCMSPMKKDRFQNIREILNQKPLLAIKEDEHHDFPTAEIGIISKTDNEKTQISDSMSTQSQFVESKKFDNKDQSDSTDDDDESDNYYNFYYFFKPIFGYNIISKICLVLTWSVYFLVSFVSLMMSLDGSDFSMLPLGLYSLIFLVFVCRLNRGKYKLWYLPFILFGILSVISFLVPVNGMPFRMLCAFAVPYIIALLSLLLKKQGISGWQLIKK